MQDGLGLVFEQQGNTGAAAYNQPNFQIGNNPFDRIAADLEQKGDLVFQNNLIEERQRKAAEQKQYNPDLQLGDVWDTDIQYLGEQMTGVKSELANLAKNRIMPNDYSNPESQKYNQLLQGLEGAKVASKQQKKIHDQLALELAKDVNDKAGLYDQEASAKNLAEFRALKPHERVNYDTSKLLVRKPKVYSTYEPLKDFKIDPYVGGDKLDTETGGHDNTVLNKKNLREDIDAMANDPINNDHYEWGKNQPIPLWNSKKEYADELYKSAENKYSPKLAKTIKNPNAKKGLTIVDIENGNADDLIATLGVGVQNPKVRSAGGQFIPSVAKNAITLGNIYATISGNTAIDASTGKAFDANGRTITSGTMSTPLVNKGTNRVVAIPKEGGTYQTRINGKDVDLEGTYEEIAQQLIDLGLAEYKPMIEGTGTYKNKPFTAWVPAESIVQGTQQKDKALEGAEQAYYILKKKAEQMNGGTSQASLKSGANKEEGKNKKVIPGF